MGVNVGAITPWRVVVPSHEIVTNLSRYTYEKLHCKREPYRFISLAGSFGTHTHRHTALDPSTKHNRRFKLRNWISS